jgi:hypothetical protein
MIEQVGQGGERHCRGIGPTGAVPLAARYTPKRVAFAVK